MKKFSMKCSCGDVMTVDANNREEAVEKMKAMMDQNALDQHWMQKHQGDTAMPKPTVEESNMHIDKMLVEGETGEAAPPTGAPSGGGMPPPPSAPPTGTPPSAPPTPMA